MRSTRPLPVLALLAGLALAPAPSLAQTPAVSPDPPHLLEGDSAPSGSAEKSGPQPWRVQIIAMPERPAHVLASHPLVRLGAVRIVGESGAGYSITDCDAGLCAKPDISPPLPDRLPPDALPGSHVATAAGRIAKAWFADPVQRIEDSAIGAWVAGALVVEDNIGRRFRLDLPLDAAFEDLRPRIIPAGSGGTETMVLAVRSTSGEGASLVAVTLVGEGLLQIAAETAPMGRHRAWINPIGIADFTGGGHTSVAIVATPDDHGRLQIYDFTGHDFELRFEIPGVSTHIPGRDIVDMAAIGDFEANGTADIAVPDASRRTVRILSVAHRQVAEPATIALPAPIATEIASIQATKGGRPLLLMGLDDGQLVLLH